MTRAAKQGVSSWNEHDSVVGGGVSRGGMSTLRALNDVGFTVPAAGGTYWVGEAMQKVDYNEAGPKADTTGAATKTLAVASFSSLVHRTGRMTACEITPRGWPRRAADPQMFRAAGGG